MPIGRGRLIHGVRGCKESHDCFLVSSEPKDEYGIQGIHFNRYAHTPRIILCLVCEAPASQESAGDTSQAQAIPLVQPRGATASCAWPRRRHRGVLHREHPQHASQPKCRHTRSLSILLPNISPASILGPTVHQLVSQSAFEPLRHSAAMLTYSGSAQKRGWQALQTIFLLLL